MPKATICLWFNGDAEDAAHVYAATCPDSTASSRHQRE
jgi:predicted 3-demethylubiquinone-9 3-methyltransferase (glyoxalase superfamily)